MKILILAVLLGSSALARACVIKSDGLHVDTMHASIINLMSQAEQYNEKIVSIKGVLEWDTGKFFRVYLNPSSKKYMILPESVSLELNISQNQYEQLKLMVGKFITVNGSFRSNDKSNDIGSLYNVKFLCKAISIDSYRGAD